MQAEADRLDVVIEATQFKHRKDCRAAPDTDADAAFRLRLGPAID
jgi:hypothetical protein